MKKDEAKTMSLPRNMGGEYRRNGYVVPCNLPTTIKSPVQVNYICKLKVLIILTRNTVTDI